MGMQSGQEGAGPVHQKTVAELDVEWTAALQDQGIAQLAEQGRLEV